MRVGLRPLLALCLAWCLCLPGAAQPADSDPPNPRQQGPALFVSDPQGVLAPGTVQALNGISQRIAQQTGVEFAVAVLAGGAGDATAFDHALRLFNTWGVGQRGADNGLLLYVAMGSRDYQFITGRGLEGVLPDIALKRLAERHLVPEMRAGRVDAAFLATAGAVEAVLRAPDQAAELRALGLVQDRFLARHRDLLQSLGLLVACYAAVLAWLHWASARFRRRCGAPKARAGALLGGLHRALWRYGPGAALAWALLSLFALLFAMMPIGLLSGDAGQARLAALWRWALPNRAAALWWHGLGWGSMALMLAWQYQRQAVAALADGPVQRDALWLAWGQQVWPFWLASAFTWPALWAQRRARTRWRARQARPPDARGGWQPVDRALPTDALSALQRTEEAVGARVYQPWRQAGTGALQLRAHDGDAAARFAPCPACGGQTLPVARAVRVVRAPTRRKGGLGQWERVCRHCGHTLELGPVELPRVQDTSGSGGGSGGGSSSGSGRSGSSGGSFGGGSSGGGGAGGRW